jgi:hypothetical protein
VNEWQNTNVECGVCRCFFSRYGIKKHRSACSPIVACQCPTPNFDDTEQCRRCLRLDLRAPRAAALAAAYDARYGLTTST